MTYNNKFPTLKDIFKTDDSGNILKSNGKPIVRASMKNIDDSTPLYSYKIAPTEKESNFFVFLTYSGEFRIFTNNNLTEEERDYINKLKEESKSKRIGFEIFKTTDKGSPEEEIEKEIKKLNGYFSDSSKVKTAAVGQDYMKLRRELYKRKCKYGDNLNFGSSYESLKKNEILCGKCLNLIKDRSKHKEHIDEMEKNVMQEIKNERKELEDEKKLLRQKEHGEKHEDDASSQTRSRQNRAVVEIDPKQALQIAAATPYGSNATRRLQSFTVVRRLPDSPSPPSQVIATDSISPQTTINIPQAAIINVLPQQQSRQSQPRVSQRCEGRVKITVEVGGEFVEINPSSEKDSNLIIQCYREIKKCDDWEKKHPREVSSSNSSRRSYLYNHARTLTIKTVQDWFYKNGKDLSSSKGTALFVDGEQKEIEGKCLKAEELGTESGQMFESQMLFDFGIEEAREKSKNKTTWEEDENTKEVKELRETALSKNKGSMTFKSIEALYKLHEKFIEGKISEECFDKIFKEHIRANEGAPHPDLKVGNSDMTPEEFKGVVFKRCVMDDGWLLSKVRSSTCGKIPNNVRVSAINILKEGEVSPIEKFYRDLLDKKLYKYKVSEWTEIDCYRHDFDKYKSELESYKKYNPSEYESISPRIAAFNTIKEKSCYCFDDTVNSLGVCLKIFSDDGTPERLKGVTLDEAESKLRKYIKELKRPGNDPKEWYKGEGGKIEEISGKIWGCNKIRERNIALENAGYGEHTTLPDIFSPENCEKLRKIIREEVDNFKKEKEENKKFLEEAEMNKKKNIEEHNSAANEKKEEERKKLSAELLDIGKKLEESRTLKEKLKNYHLKSDKEKKEIMAEVKKNLENDKEKEKEKIAAMELEKEIQKDISKLFKKDEYGDWVPTVEKRVNVNLPFGHYDITPSFMKNVKIVFVDNSDLSEEDLKYNGSHLHLFNKDVFDKDGIRKYCMKIIVNGDIPKGHPDEQKGVTEEEQSYIDKLKELCKEGLTPFFDFSKPNFHSFYINYYHWRSGRNVYNNSSSEEFDKQGYFNDSCDWTKNSLTDHVFGKAFKELLTCTPHRSPEQCKYKDNYIEKIKDYDHKIKDAHKINDAKLEKAKMEKELLENRMEISEITSKIKDVQEISDAKLEKPKIEKETLENRMEEIKEDENERKTRIAKDENEEKAKIEKELLENRIEEIKKDENEGRIRIDSLSERMKFLNSRKDAYNNVDDRELAHRELVSDIKKYAEKEKNTIELEKTIQKDISKLFERDKEGNWVPTVEKRASRGLPAGHYDITPSFMKNVKIVFTDASKFTRNQWEKLFGSREKRNYMDVVVNEDGPNGQKGVTKEEQSYIDKLKELCNKGLTPCVKHSSFCRVYPKNLYSLEKNYLAKHVFSVMFKDETEHINRIVRTGGVMFRALSVEREKEINCLEAEEKYSSHIKMSRLSLAVTASKNKGGRNWMSKIVNVGNSR
ncbi:MAG: hypothetical protein LBC92_00120 [Rickettsiales bacterium]|jgi:hypothetical protein|nr:hypothetical protein [Rickettsiales bacterium]